MARAAHHNCGGMPRRGRDQSRDREGAVWRGGYSSRSTSVPHPELRYGTGHPLPYGRGRALTLVESVVSIALVGGLLVAALNTVGSMRVAEADGAVRARAYLLAEELMSEILAQAYADPECIGTVAEADLGKTQSCGLGPDLGEWGSGRDAYDDVDDYRYVSNQPPENRDGTAIVGANDFTRIVSVAFLNPADLSTSLMVETGLKRITVTVQRDGDDVAELSVYRSMGLPTTRIRLRVLLVVPDAANLGPGDVDRQALLESWDDVVTLIDDSDSQASFDAAILVNQVVLISAEADEAELSTKLRYAAIGVVNECRGCVVELDIATGTKKADRNRIYITDNSHDITTGYDEDAYLNIFTATQPLYTLSGFAPLNLQFLAYTQTKGTSLYPSLAVLEAGASLLSGGTALGRRVQLPWGRAGVDIDTLTVDGQTILFRALEWAVGP